MTHHKTELVVPATTTPRERKHLSDIDDQGSLRFQLPLLLFYNYDPSLIEVNKDPAKVIKEGLSKTLVFYYPLAGRIIELENNKKLVVDCTGEGILFVEADAHVELDKLGDSIKPPCPYLDQLLYNVPGSDGIIGCPLLLVQCRTIALGLDPNLTYLVNARGKSLKFEVPLGYYGNALVSPAVVSKAGLLCSSPLTYAVELVKRVKNHMNEEYIRSVADLFVIKGRPELTKSWNFIISDNRSAGFDEVDLGWGNPIFGGVPKAISNVSFCVPIKNKMGEKAPLAMEKFQQVYEMAVKNVEEGST
ncbi:hypothetical protein K7X08_033027 [Anisodus acutangulus]|uniref:Uncharacterized protein n=1 Tax=Anisodus acutangulus TaxID=402998 RepID=A0A9Q1M4F4_9SOLA|nr:hypothetical protein K7X08_033027 [Anisodus acutangulus]